MCVLSIPGKFPDQTFAFSGRESYTLIITKTMGCLVLDFQGLSQKTCIVYVYIYIYIYLCLNLYIYNYIYIYFIYI